MAAKTFLFEPEELIDFHLFGLISHFSESSQFVFHVNQYFRTSFEKADDIEIIINKESVYYPSYLWEDPQSGLVYHIIKNSPFSLNSQESFATLSSLFELSPFLIHAFKEYNYFLKVQDFIQDLPLKENQFIQKISKLNLDGLKEAERLIF